MSSRTRVSASPVRKHGTVKSPKLKVAVITGTRAEFGLLTPVMHAIQKHPRLKLQVIAGGAHLLPPARTIRDVRALFPIAATVPMQRPGKSGRHEDALALARGVEGFARAFAKLKPDWVVVLGDRIEAFAAASAASVAGIAVCHIHGGDRAEGIADEAMRHAITKVSHLHCAATKLSAERIVKMGEKPEHVHVTGSPAIDGLAEALPLSDEQAEKLGRPLAVVLLHPCFDPAVPNWKWAGVATILASVLAGYLWTKDARAGSDRVLYLSPNHDPGNEEIRAALTNATAHFGTRMVDHLPREKFIALLKWLAKNEGILIGNSSAGLIEAAALGVRVLNLGPRQAGRERTGRFVDIPHYPKDEDVDRVCTMARENNWPVAGDPHVHGDGHAGPRIANLLATTNPHEPSLLRKRIVY